MRLSALSMDLFSMLMPKCLAYRSHRSLSVKSGSFISHVFISSPPAPSTFGAICSPIVLLQACLFPGNVVTSYARKNNKQLNVSLTQVYFSGLFNSVEHFISDIRRVWDRHKKLLLVGNQLLVNALY